MTWKVTLSPDEDQVAFFCLTLFVTIYDNNAPGEGRLSNPADFKCFVFRVTILRFRPYQGCLHNHLFQHEWSGGNEGSAIDLEEREIEMELSSRRHY